MTFSTHFASYNAGETAAFTTTKRRGSPISASSAKAGRSRHRAGQYRHPRRHPGGGRADCTTGTWTGTPTGYAYAWAIDGTQRRNRRRRNYTRAPADAGANRDLASSPRRTPPARRRHRLRSASSSHEQGNPTERRCARHASIMRTFAVAPTCRRLIAVVEFYAARELAAKRLAQPLRPPSPTPTGSTGVGEPRGRTAASSKVTATCMAACTSLRRPRPSR